MPDPVVHFEIQSKMPDELLKFYSDAFGWNITDMSAGDVRYLIVDTQGGDGINGGIGTGGGGPNLVTVYIAVDDQHATLDKIAKAGGRTLMGPDDVMPGLTISMFADPEGNIVGLVNNAPPEGDQPQGPSAGNGKAVTWFEILGNDGKKLHDFYSKVFGWKLGVDDQYGYGQLDAKAGISGGIGASRSGPAVTFYAKTDDLPAMLKKIESLGGKTVVEPQEVFTIEFAQFADPEGNVIGLYRNL
jgi:uncharacterized protein